MSITQSGATVDTTTRDQLLNDEVGKEYYDFTLSAKKGAKLAGITASFAANVKDEIDTYIENVDAKIAEIEAIESTGAFQGEAISGALKTFVESVKHVATEYTAKLKAAEQQIIDSVETAYRTQDTDLSDSLNETSTKFDANTPNP